VPAPSHTPGPRPTNPPGEEQALRQAFAAALQARSARLPPPPGPPTTRLAINGIHIQGDWALVGIHMETVAGAPIPAGGGLVVARKLDNQWRVAFADDPEYRDWLDAMPDSLMTPQDRQFF
jgi:hypothetical protein